jgi:DNA topoisomerase III
MNKKLIIAEKPSVAADIAKALGGFTKQVDYFENDEYVISSAIGHLLEINAQSVDVKRGKWSLNNLPVIPQQFDIAPIEKTESRLKLLVKLIKRKDISSIINACDAGREGELIFKLIAQYSATKKPVERLWLQSMTQQSIIQGFKALRPDSAMQALSDAARCRSESDWLVGINGTRALTAFNSKDGGFFLTTVGRVQTPTLSIVVEREEKRKKFMPQNYYELLASFKSKHGTYEAKWFDELFNKPQHEHDRESRIFDQQKAEKILTACKNNTSKISASDETKPSNQNAPTLFDLTTLQREINARFGISAKNTLAIAQALYEKHKVITYPRTDSKHLPQDYIATVQETLNNLGDQQANYKPFIKQALKGVVQNKRIFDDTKISDHFAIIPTLQVPKSLSSLSDIEQKVYDIIVRRFIAIFYPAATYLITTRITVVDEYKFKTEGKVLTSSGWLAVYNKAEQDDTICELDSACLSLANIDMQEHITNPPARYNEATLLSSMEGAGKLIEDEELRQAMNSKGLGTPATRASIIEGLLKEKYIIRDGKELIPTAKAFQLINLLRAIGVDDLCKPELTGEWEYKLSQIEQSKHSRASFMQEIAQMTTKLVDKAKSYTADTIPGDYATLEKCCPDCGSDIQENYKRFNCTKCEFSFTKTPAGRQFELEEVQELLANKQIGPLQGFRSKQGRAFAAILKIIIEEGKSKFQFDFGQSEEALPDDAFVGQPSLGNCPKCSAKVFDNGVRYVCEKAVKTASKDKECNFVSSKIILQQEISHEEFAKLLHEGKTSLLTNFKSMRTGRGFKAFLAFNKQEAKIVFEFEPKVQKTVNGVKASKEIVIKSVKEVKTKTKAASKPKASAKPKAASKVKVASKVKENTTDLVDAKSAAILAIKNSKAKK